MAIPALFKQRNLLLLLCAQMVSYVGSTLQTVALALYVLGFASGVQFASVLAVGVLPRLFGPLTGVLSDRMNRKHLLVAFDILAGGMTLLFALVHRYGGGMQLWMVYLLVLVLSAVQTFSDPAANAILPDIVSRDHLEQANSANSFLSNASSIAMPTMAGVLYSSGGLYPIMLINAVSFFAAAVVESFLQYTPSSKTAAAHTDSFLYSLKEGFHIFRANRELALIVIISIAVNFALNPVLTVALPYILKADLHVSSQVFGLSQSLVFAGPVAASLVAGYVLRRINYRRVIIAVLLADAVLVLAMAVLSRTGLLPSFLTQVLLLTGCAFLVVATMVLGGIACMSTLQRIVPQELMGRVMGVDTSLSVAAIPAGQWLLGWGTHAAGSFTTVAAFAAIVLGVGLFSIMRYRPMLRVEQESAMQSVVES